MIVQPQFPYRSRAGIGTNPRTLPGTGPAPVFREVAESQAAGRGEATSLKLLLAHLSGRSDESALLEHLLMQAVSNWQQEGVVVLQRCLECRLIKLEPRATRARDSLAKLIRAVGDDLTELGMHADPALRWQVCELLSSPLTGSLSSDEVRLCHAIIDPALLTVREVKKLAGALELVRGPGAVRREGCAKVIRWATELPLETRMLAIDLLLKSSLAESLAAIGQVAIMAPDGNLRRAARRALAEW